MKPNSIQKEFLNLIAYVVGFIFTIATTSYLAIPLYCGISMESLTEWLRGLVLVQYIILL